MATITFTSATAALVFNPISSQLASLPSAAGTQACIFQYASGGPDLCGLTNGSGTQTISNWYHTISAGSLQAPGQNGNIADDDGQTGPGTASGPTFIATHWYCVVICWPTGASTTERISYFDMTAGGSWTHVNGTPASGGTRAGPSTTVGNYNIGSVADLTESSNALGLCGVWPGVQMTDLQAEALLTNLKTSDWWNSSAGNPSTLIEVTSVTPTDIGAHPSTFKAKFGTTSTASNPTGWTFDQHGSSTVNGTCSMAATASQTVSGSAHIPGAASQSATLAQTAAGSTHIPGTASQSATLAQTVGGSAHIPGTATHTATLTQMVSGTTIIPGTVSQAATLTQTAAGTVTTGPSCTMSATLTQTVSGTTVIPGACSMSATLGQTANGSAHIPGTCSMGSTLAQTVTGSTHLPGTASMTATLAQTAAGSSHIPGSVSMAATVTQTAGGSAHIPGSLSQSATLSQTAAGHVTVHGTVTMTAVLTQTVGGSPGPITVWLPTSLRLDPVKGAFSMGVNAGTATMGAGTKPTATMGNPNPTIGQYTPKAAAAMSADTKPTAVQGNPNPHMTLAGGS